jgi:hypothetical protein
VAFERGHSGVYQGSEYVIKGRSHIWKLLKTINCNSKIPLHVSNASPRRPHFTGGNAFLHE